MTPGPREAATRDKGKGSGARSTTVPHLTLPTLKITTRDQGGLGSRVGLRARRSRSVGPAPAGRSECKTGPVTAYTSYLRAYEPLAAFPPPERKHWERYISSGAAPDRVRALRAEQRAAVVAAIGVPPANEVEHAYVHRIDGVTYVCPWRTQVRAWEAMAEFRRSMPDEIADAFFPKQAAEVAERELARLRSTEPDLKSHILSETWQVPLRWFIPFEGEERRLVLSTERSVSYLTTMSNARRRVARTLAILRRTIEDRPVIEGVEELANWLEDYHPRSLVELDYGGLVSLFDDIDLESDESAADIAHAVACLANGEPDEATEAYARVATRWGAVRSVEVAN